ncbi:uncharacterized protein CIMG_13308 [Coccidioides immitis RS]|uniref:Uncharacterized protein n=1 Tax=Coccidioides immitis (strain RS) TaxID=246410 RepID=A0A0D8JUS5_COCIM|nr:uncharacterized protein CIMG_13308 [Coccidioides immitis RS]KJF60894.1 hypothetical protein CIMG_13308 [Coccidioides immitis RS]
MNIAGNILLLSYFRRLLKQSCALYLNSVMVIMYHKYVTVNINDMKLILGISTMTELNYFSLINISDCPAPAAPAPATITCHLCFVPAPPTTATASPSLLLLTIIFLSSPGADRVFICQIAGIRAPVWFTKLVLEEQKKEEKEKKKKKKKREKKKKKKKKKEKENYNNNKNDDDDKNNNNNNDDDKLVI